VASRACMAGLSGVGAVCARAVTVHDVVSLATGVVGVPCRLGPSSRLVRLQPTFSLPLLRLLGVPRRRRTAAADRRSTGQHLVSAGTVGALRARCVLCGSHADRQLVRAAAAARRVLASVAAATTHLGTGHHRLVRRRRLRLHLPTPGSLSTTPPSSRACH